jgi:hypothetical protein
MAVLRLCSKFAGLKLDLPRLVLCLLCILAVHGFYVVEQPRTAGAHGFLLRWSMCALECRQSILFEYFRWRWFQETVSYVP